MLKAPSVPDHPPSVELILGTSGITALGGVSLRVPTDVTFLLFVYWAFGTR